MTIHIYINKKGDGEAILFLSPLTTVIAARCLLGEKLPTTFFCTLVLTLTGLIFICQPTFIFGYINGEYSEMSLEGLLFLLGAVIAWSGACVLVRTAKDAHWLQLEITATIQSIFIWCPLVILINRLWLHSDDLSGGDWDFSLSTGVVMVVIGVLGFSALMLNVIGYQIGDATKVAWMEYLDLVFAFLYQWLYFGNTPTNWEIIGCASLLSTCFIHLAEEYYNYLKHKSQKETIQKEISSKKEGIPNNTINMAAAQIPSIIEETNNENEPLLSKNTDINNNNNNDNFDKNKLKSLVNKLNMFNNNNNNDYSHIDEDKQL